MLGAAIAGGPVTPATAAPSARAVSVAETMAPDQTVARGPARSIGEPAAAEDSAVGVVVATTFGSAGAQVRAWTRPTGSAAWAAAGPVLPSGFGSSYDASAAASPGGPVLVVAGASPGGRNCIADGSVAIVNVESTGRLGPARLVSDQRGTGSFDDRPAVAVGPDGTVWVAWSQGPDADACQNVGPDDRLEVTVSHDGGRTFAAPVTMPAGGGGSAFGARLAPLPGGRVAVSWVESMGHGHEAVLVSVLGPGGRPSQPQRVMTGDGLPLTLPGASFYDFPAGDITALPSGRLVVAMPLWEAGHAVIKVGSGVPGEPWQTSDIGPPEGADLLLPALAYLSPTAVRLLCAVHTRSGDRLGYDWTDIRLGAQGHVLVPAGLAALTPAPDGPGFFEIGEELSISRAPDGLLSALVVAGSGGARLEAESWRLPRPAATPSPRPSSAATTSPAQAGGSRGSRSGGVGHAGSSSAGPAAWTAAAVIACAGLIAWWAARRRRRAPGG